MKFDRRKTLIIALTITAVIVAIGMIFLFVGGSLTVLRPENYESEVDFSFNGRQYTTPSTIWGLNGKYSIKASYDGAIPFNEDVSVNLLQRKSLNLVLNPTNPDDTAIGAYEGGVDMNQVIERAAKKNPLIQYLPEFTSDYNIDYDINPDTGIVSYFIESNETEPDTDPNILPVGVRDFIKSKGIDPDTIKFEWREKSL